MAYFDKNSGGYWYQDAKGAWVRFQQNDFIRFLKSFGYSSKVADGQIQSGVDQVLMDIQMGQNVDYAGPVAGYPQGLIDMEGKSVLVTDSPKIVLPEPGEYPMLQEMLLNMFGEEQLRFFQAWCKLGYESLASGQLRPGHAVVMAGPRASGKSLVQKLVTKMLGGRAAHPYLYMTGGTSFNSELFGAEHLIIDDQCGNSDFRSRQKLTAQFKMITAAGSQQCHPKGKPAVTLIPFWRQTVSVNDDPESLLVLPLIREDLADKIMLFKIEHHDMPMPTRTNHERDAFWNQLMAELPHWLHYLNGWEIPVQMQGDRYGVTHYHHPDIVEAIDSLSPQTKFFNLLQAHFSGTFRPLMPWIGTAAELETLLTAPGAHSPYEARKLLYWTTACGTYLSDASTKHPDNVKRANRQDNQHQWEINFPVNRVAPPPIALLNDAGRQAPNPMPGVNPPPPTVGLAS